MPNSKHKQKLLQERAKITRGLARKGLREAVGLGRNFKDPLVQGMADFFCKRINSKYFQLCWPYDVCRCSTKATLDSN